MRIFTSGNRNLKKICALVLIIPILISILNVSGFIYAVADQDSENSSEAVDGYSGAGEAGVGENPDEFVLDGYTLYAKDFNMQPVDYKGETPSDDEIDHWARAGIYIVDEDDHYLPDETIIVTEYDGFSPDIAGTYKLKYKAVLGEDVIAVFSRTIYNGTGFRSFMLTGQPPVIGGDRTKNDLLKIQMEYGNQSGKTAVYRWQYISGAWKWQQQYFGEANNGINVVFDNVAHNTIDFGSGLSYLGYEWDEDEYSQTCTTIYQDTAQQIYLRFTIKYVHGMPFIERSYEVINRTSNTLSNVFLKTGGDTYFANSDSGYNYYSGAANMTYVTKDTTSGMMAFIGDERTPFNQSYGGAHSGARAKAGSNQEWKSYTGVDHYADSTFKDADYHVQWNFGDLGPGESVQVYAQELFTDPGDIAVYAPVPKSAPQGAVVTYKFSVMNMLNTTTSVDLTAVSEHGWTTALDQSTLTLGPMETKTVNVSVRVPGEIDPSIVRDNLTVTASNASASASSTTYTNIDNSMKAITNVNVSYKSDDRLDIVVKFNDQVPANTLTTVRLMDMNGNFMDAVFPPVTQTISSGDTIGNMVTTSVPAGQYYIHVTAQDVPYPNSSAIYHKNGITEIPIVDLTISPANLTINIGQTLTSPFTVNYVPSDVTDQFKGVTWKSSDAAIAIIDAATGALTGVSEGQVVIEAVSIYDQTIVAEAHVTVVPVVTGVTLSPNTQQLIKVGDQLQLTASVAPNNAVNKDVTWSSDSTGVATIPNTNTFVNQVTGVSDGQAVITVRTVDQDKTATVTVQVDGTAPVIDSIGLTISGNTTNIVDSSVAVNGDMVLQVAAHDPVVNAVSAGMSSVFYALVSKDSTPPTFSASPGSEWTALTLNAGIHEANIAGLSTGNYDLYIGVIDQAGNFTAQKYGNSIGMDLIAPTISAPRVDLFVGSSFVPLDGIVVTDQTSDGFIIILPNSSVTVTSNPVNINVPGLYQVQYTAVDVAGNQGTATRLVYVHGKPQITANDVVVNQQEGSIDLKNDPRIGLAASVQKVVENGSSIYTSIALDDISVTGTVDFNTLGIYTITYTIVYTAVPGLTTTVSEQITVEVVANGTVPGGPGVNPPGPPTSPIEGIDAETGVLNYYIGHGVPGYIGTIDAAAIQNAVESATTGTGPFTFTYTLNGGAFTEALLTAALADVDEHEIVATVVDNDNNMLVYTIQLRVNGDYNVTGDMDIHVLQDPDSLPESEYKGAGGVTVTYEKYDGTTVTLTAAVTPDPVNIGAYGASVIMYAYDYPGSLTPVTVSRNLYVHEKPVISAQNIEIDTQENIPDFITDPRIALGVTVRYFDGLGASQTYTFTAADLAGVTVTHGIHQGGTGITPGLYPVEYEAAWHNPVLNANVVSDWTIQVDVVETVAGAPVVSASDMYYYQGHGTLTEALIKGNASVTLDAGASSHTLTYTILDYNGNTVTEATAMAILGIYTIRYQAKDDLNRSGFKTIYLYVNSDYDLLETGIDRIDVERKAGQNLDETLYKGAAGFTMTYFDYTGTPVEVVPTITGGTPSIGTIGRFTIQYSFSYPGDSTPIVKERYLYVHGGIEFTSANTVNLNMEEEPNFSGADLLNLRGDSRLNLSAQYTFVKDDGTTEIKAISQTNINQGGSITWAAGSSSTITYTASVSPVSALIMTGSKDVTVNVFANGAVPGGPEVNPTPTTPITVDGGQHVINYYQGHTTLTSTQLENAIKSSVTGTNTPLTYAYQLDGGTLDAAALTAALSGLPAEHVVKTTVTDAQSNILVYSVYLRVNSDYTVANNTDIHVAQAAGNLPVSDYDALASAVTMKYTDYLGNEVSLTYASISPIGIANTGSISITYTFDYPGTVGTDAVTRKLFVHGVPALTVNDPVNVNVLIGSINVLTNPIMGVQNPTVQQFNVSGVSSNVTPNVEVTMPTAVAGVTFDGITLNFTGLTNLPKTVTLVYTAAYMNPVLGKLSTQQTITVVINPNGSGPTDPEVTLPPNGIISADGVNKIDYFQNNGVIGNGNAKIAGVPSVSDIQGAITVTTKPTSGNPVTTSITLSISGGAASPLTAANLTTALDTIGEHTLVYDIHDTANNSHTFYTVKLRVNSDMVIDQTSIKPVDSTTADATLNTALYTGDNNAKASYTDYLNQTVNLTVAPQASSIDTLNVATMNILYTADYPYSNQTIRRLTRIHGIPVFAGTTDLHLRTDATAAELETVTATVQLAGESLGDLPQTVSVTVTLEGTPALSTVGTFNQTYKATYPLPASYGNTLNIMGTATRKIVVHGVPVITANDVAFARGYSNSFDPSTHPLVALHAEVQYYDVVANNVVTKDITNLVSYNISAVDFNINGTYQVTYQVADTTVAEKPAALPGATANGSSNVIISDTTGGIPSFSGIKDVKLLEDSAFADTDVRGHVTANDPEDGDVTNSITYVVTDSVGTPVLVGDVTNTPGTYTVKYSVQDSVGNKVEKEAKIYVYGKLTVVTPLSDVDERVRQETASPNYSALKYTYEDPIGAIITVTPSTHPHMFTASPATVNYRNIGDTSVDLQVKHPALPDLAAAEKADSFTVHVHGQIEILGTDTVANGVYRIGDTIDTVTPVTARYTNSSNAPITLLVTAMPGTNLNYSNPSNQIITYSVADDLIATNPNTVKEITINVHGNPQLNVSKNTVTVQAKTSKEAVEQLFGALGYIYYGDAPGVKALLQPQFNFTAVNLSQVGVYTASVSVTDRYGAIQTIIGLTVNVYGAVEFDVDTSALYNGNSVVVYKGESTKADVEGLVNATAEYEDSMGATQALPVHYEWNPAKLHEGGVYSIKLWVTNPYTGEKVYASKTIDLYVLNRPYISTVRTRYEIDQGRNVSTNGYEFGPKGIGEQPVFAERRIERVNFTPAFDKMSLDTQVIGVYDCRFTAAFMDFSGTELALTKPVKVDVVLPIPRDLADQAMAANSDFWLTVADKVHSAAKGEHWEIDTTNYIHGGRMTGEVKGQSYTKLVDAYPTQDYYRMSDTFLRRLGLDKEVRVEVHLADMLTWRFEGERVEDNIPRIYEYYDLSFDTDQDANVAAMFSGANQMQLNFAMRSKWFAEPTLLVTLDGALAESANRGSRIFMYCYNEDTNELEIIGEMSRQADGRYAISMSGVYGRYIIADTIPGTRQSDVSSGKSNDSDFAPVRITENTNEMSQETYDYIQEQLNSSGKSIEQISLTTPTVIQPMENSNGRWRILIGLGIFLLLVVAISIWIIVWKRKKSNDVSLYEAAKA